MVYDYIVIGSGFGGSVASLRLVEKGYKILTIEQGRRYKPADFPKTNWNLPKYLWVPALRFFGFQRLSFFTTASILSGTGVGGGSLVYANTLYIPPDQFFRNASWERSQRRWERMTHLIPSLWVSTLTKKARRGIPISKGSAPFGKAAPNAEDAWSDAGKMPKIAWI